MRGKTTRAARATRAAPVTRAVATGPRGPLKKKGESEEDKIEDMSSGSRGLFTTVDPEVRRIVPEAKGRVVVKVTYVVLEAQYQSALSAAVKQINETNDKVCVEVTGYLLEELRNADNLAALKKDVESSNIFIGSLIFIEELAEKIVEIVTPCRENLDACLIFPSMPQVMRLNKLGTFSMAQLGQSKSAAADRFRHSNSQQTLLSKGGPQAAIVSFVTARKIQQKLIRRSIGKNLISEFSDCTLVFCVIEIHAFTASVSPDHRGQIACVFKLILLRMFKEQCSVEHGGHQFCELIYTQICGH